MTASAVAEAALTDARRVPDPTVGFRRRVSALLLPLGFAVQIVANGSYAYASRNGGSDETGKKTLELYGSEPGAMQLSAVAALIGVALIIPGVFAAARVLRTTVPRLSLIAAIILAAGYLAYFGLAATSFDDIALALGGVDAASALDHEQANPAVIVMGVVFIVGNLGGPVLLAIAVLRSRAVPRWAAIGILAWPVLHITGLVVGSEWFEVAGGVLQVIGLAVVASAAFRITNEEWARRG